MYKNRRIYFEIIHAILAFAEKPQKKTHIIYKVRMTSNQLVRYTTFLRKVGLLEKTEKGYCTTKTGRIYVKVFETIQTLLSPEEN